MNGAATISQKIDYLRRCLLADRGYAGVSNIFGSRVSHMRLLKGREELASGELTETLLPPSFGKDIAANETLYRREKECLYGVLILAGRHEGRVWNAPLLLFPASFVHDEAGGDYWPLRLAEESWRLNTALRPLIDEWDDFEGEVRQAMGEGMLSWGAAGVIARLLVKYGLIVNVEAVDSYPELAAKADLTAASKFRRWTLFPAACVSLVSRSRGVSGVLDELQRILSISDAPLPLALRVFLGAESPVQEIEILEHRIPTTLSRSQKSLLDASAQSVMTVCHGPPGTGKSYTIACAALAAASRGESVLISSRNDQAVDVVAEKMLALSGGKEGVVRAGRSSYLKEVKEYVQACLSGQAVVSVASDNAFRKRKKELKSHQENLDRLSLEIGSRVQMELELGELLRLKKRSMFQHIHKMWLEMRLGKQVTLSEKYDEYKNLYQSLIKQIALYLRKERGVCLRGLLTKSAMRNELTSLAKALRKTRSHDQEQAFKEVDFSLVGKALPVWLVNLQDCHRVLPLEAEMFDLAIIDEASQCDLASILPLIYRAKRVLLMGDPMQLRHVSFLSGAFIEKQAGESGIVDIDSLHFRKRSALDLAIDVSSVAGKMVFLDEYYRSPGGLVSFNNTEFYQGQLRMMQMEIGREKVVSPECIHVAGERDADGVNAPEVKAVIEYLKSHLKKGQGQTIGVLSPFRDQVTAIEGALSECLTTEEFNQLMKLYDFRLGTPFEFQGDERDVMLLSFALSDGSSVMARRYIEQDGVFNVATSRSREQMVVFYSFNPAALPVESMLRRFLSHAVNEEKSRSPEPENWSSECIQVFKQLKKEAGQIMCEVLVAGISVDILLLKDGKTTAIDLIGFPGLLGRALERGDCHILHRAGVGYSPLTYREWVSRDSGAILNKN